MPELDDDMVLAHAFAREARERKSRRWRRRAAPAPRRTRAWWTNSATAQAASGGGAATRAAALQESLPDDGTGEPSEPTLAEFLDGL